MFTKATIQVKVFVLACLFIQLALPASGARPDAAPGVPEPIGGIIEKFIQASGGSELQKIRTETRQGTLVRGASGSVPFEMSATDAGKWRYHQVFAYGDQVTYGCDGAQSWVQDTQGILPLPYEERLELTLVLDPQLPCRLGKIFPEMSVKGEERINEKQAVVIQAASPEGVRLELAFDRTSGLLLRAGDLFFEDYRDVGKVKRPFVVWIGAESGQDSLRLKMQVAAFQQNVDVDESIFAKPLCALRVGPPVLYSLRVAVPVSREALAACVGVYQSVDDPNVFFTVTTQGDHLMIERTGWGISVEILPESETDYFMRFLNREFHFTKDANGRMTRLAMGPDRARKAKKIK